MVSGTDLFLGLFHNLAIFIVLIAGYDFLYGYYYRGSALFRQVVFGFAFGIFAILCMYVKIPVAEGVIVDQRNAVVVLSGAFGGPLSAFLSAVMAGAFRIYLGGSGVSGGIAGICLSALAGIAMFRLRIRIDTIPKAFLASLAATIIILPGFILIDDLHRGWALLKEMIIPYGSAVFTGIFLVGLLLANGERRHAATIAQKESEKRFRSLFENLIDVSYRTDREDRITIISPSSESISGYKPEELIGKRMPDLYRYPSRRAAFIEKLHRDGHVEDFRAEVRKKDGSFVWISTNAKILRDNKGDFTGVEAVARDISSLKRAEENMHKLEEKLRQSQKMEAIGTLAGGIAHDFNNILSPIMAYSEMSMMDLPEDHPIQENLCQIFTSSKRARDLVRQILDFSRRKGPERIPLQLGNLVKELTQLLRSSIPTTISINCNIKTDDDTLFADPTQIHQVILNLCTNASHAMREKGGSLDIELDNRRIGKAIASLHAGKYLQMTVKDTGQGIAPEIMDRIFEPYFTTKRSGEGTGMGLAAVHGIVRNHGGEISCESETGKGTTFRILFPLYKQEATEDKKGAPPAFMKGSERILLVDDEKEISLSVKKMLENLGYSVSDHTSSIEALETFRNNPCEFDMVITDQTMPELSGNELAEKLMSIRTGVPIIICTGFSDRIDEKTAKESGISELVMKPIMISEISSTIRKVLDRKKEEQGL